MVVAGSDSAARLESRHSFASTVLAVRCCASAIWRVTWGNDQALYGLQAKGLDGKQACASSVEEMAADYIRDIQQVQPKGRTFLADTRLAAWWRSRWRSNCALEGEEVGLVALLDTFPGRPMSSSELLVKLLRMPVREKISYSIGRARRFATYLQRRLSRQLPPDLLESPPSLLFGREPLRAERFIRDGSPSSGRVRSR